MTIIVIQARRAGKVAAMADAIAAHYRMTAIAEDPALNLTPFPADGTLLFSERRPADIIRWRDRHRSTGTGDVMRFLTLDQALDEIARSLTAGMRRPLTAPNPDLIHIGGMATAEAFERKGLGIRIRRNAYCLSTFGRDLRARFENERRAA
ncbi:MAG: hypothetical protein QM690_16055 [Sphingobium sp.]